MITLPPAGSGLILVQHEGTEAARPGRISHTPGVLFWSPQLGLQMPSRAEQYRARAAECELRAKEARYPDAKHDFEELALQWLALAEQMERLSR